MPWCKKRRFIDQEYSNHIFKPVSIPMSQLPKISIGHDEMEAIRLVDLEHMRQADAAEKMGISPATIQRMVETTREKITKALIDGYAIIIEGGDYKIKKEV